MLHSEIVYKLYRNSLPLYFENFIPVYGDSRYNLRNRCIHLPGIRCEFGKINAKFQMHVILRELGTPGNPPIYPMIDNNEDILSKSVIYYSNYINPIRSGLFQTVNDPGGGL